MKVELDRLDILAEMADDIVRIREQLIRERLGPPLVYIAGPYSGETATDVARNVASATRLGIEVAKLGAFPFIPHANTGHPAFEKAQPYDFWIAGTMAMLYRCDAVLMVDGWEKSKGANGEYDEALRIGMPVFDQSQMTGLANWIRLKKEVTE